MIAAAFGSSFGFLLAFFSRELSSIMSSTPEVIAYFPTMKKLERILLNENQKRTPKGVLF